MTIQYCLYMIVEESACVCCFSAGRDGGHGQRGAGAGVPGGREPAVRSHPGQAETGRRHGHRRGAGGI